MKKIIYIILFMGAAMVSQDLFAQDANHEKVIESKSSTIVKTRGSKPIFGFLRRKGQPKFLACPDIGRKRGLPPKCCITIDNGVKQIVDVYIDGIYQGSIKENDKGVIQGLSKYSEIVCLTADEKLSWKENGDCASPLLMKLIP